MRTRATHDAADAHDAHANGADEDLQPIPTEEEQRETSPHAGHADDLANAAGADGVIPPDLNDGLGQAGTSPDGPQPRYVSWIVPTAAVAIGWVLA